jgi:hypothetical protein
MLYFLQKSASVEEEIVLKGNSMENNGELAKKMFIERIGQLIKIEQDCSLSLLGYLEETILEKTNTASAVEKRRLEVLHQEALTISNLLTQSIQRLAEMPRAEITSVKKEDS